jgi:hypothetical protein
MKAFVPMVRWNHMGNSCQGKKNMKIDTRISVNKVDEAREEIVGERSEPKFF